MEYKLIIIKIVSFFFYSKSRAYKVSLPPLGLLAPTGAVISGCINAVGHPTQKVYDKI